MKRKVLTSLFAAAAVSLSASAMATPSISNRDGTLVPFDGFDWAKNGTAISTPVNMGGISVGDTFSTYYFATATAITDPDGNNIFAPNLYQPGVGGTFSNNQYQYTIVAEFNERVDSITGGQADFSTTGGTWSIYYDHAGSTNTVADMAAGTGFDDGIKILWGSVTPQDIGIFNALTNSGEFHFSGVVDDTNTTYINPEMISTVAFGTLQFDQNTTGWKKATGRPNGGGTATPNGLGDNIALQFQADGNQNFSPIPEPGILALLGLGMFGLFATTRRRNNQVA